MTKPFLRWAGGKSWLLSDIESFLPMKIKNYYEPFLGGGSIFLYLQEQNRISGQAFLSDINNELIEAYIQVRDNIEEVIQCLKKYRNEEDFYYQLRNASPMTAVEQTARFIFLNRTCFNGIYRVNLKGYFNVPFGFKKYSVFIDYDNLRQISDLLKGVQLFSQDFQRSIESINQGDLVFLDPPYTVAHGNNGFIKYNEKIFAWDDQKRLATSIEMIIERNAYFIMTNAVHESIESLFESCGSRRKLTRFSVIGGKNASRGQRSEYVFWNI
jgi:DNA adenine methylase